MFCSSNGSSSGGSELFEDWGLAGVGGLEAPGCLGLRGGCLGRVFHVSSSRLAMAFIQTWYGIILKLGQLQCSDVQKELTASGF